VRVTGGRFLLEILWWAHQQGMTPEQIVEQFDTLSLPDVYAAIGYCLRHRAEVEAYLARRDAEAAEVRRMVEARQRRFPTRAELLARWAARAGRDRPPAEQPADGSAGHAGGP
jgi:predicted Fe-S protein YdhL (DUF1289 family)